MSLFDTVTRQDKLAIRQAIHWAKLATGQHVGVRKSAAGTFTWFARIYIPGSGPGAQSKHKLGDFGALPAPNATTRRARLRVSG